MVDDAPVGADVTLGSLGSTRGSPCTRPGVPVAVRLERAPARPPVADVDDVADFDVDFDAADFDVDFIRLEPFALAPVAPLGSRGSVGSVAATGRGASWEAGELGALGSPVVTVRA